MKMDNATIQAPVSWVSRVKEALNGKFERNMSHAVIFLAIYEANRIIEKNKDEWSISEPFQRKPATLYLALDLIYTIDFITQEDKKYIIDENKPFLINRAFNSVRNSDTRIRSVILPRVKEWVELGKSHDAVCLALEQNGFKTKIKSKTVRRRLLVIYRVYYRGLSVDPNISVTQAPRIPKVKVPKDPSKDDLGKSVFAVWSPMKSSKNKNMTEEKTDTSIDLQTQRLHHVRDLKCRLDLLNQIWKHGGFALDEMKNEKEKIFSALCHLPNRNCTTRETRLLMEILKDLIDSDVRSSQCVKLMKDMYIGLPSLPCIDDTNKKQTERIAKEAACMPDVAENEDANASEDKVKVACITENQYQTNVEISDETENEDTNASEDKVKVACIIQNQSQTHVEVSDEAENKDTNASEDKVEVARSQIHMKVDNASGEEWEVLD